MGFEIEPMQLKLNFRDDPALAGAELVMQSLSVAEYNAQFLGGALKGDELAKANDDILRKFAENLVSWNLTSGGQPLPPTYESLSGLPSPVFTRMLAAWQRAQTTVPTTRQSESSNGSLPSRSEELTLGLGSQSESPPS